MDILFLGTLVLCGTFQMASTLNITVCDCGQAEVKGLMDIQQPLYCDKNLDNEKSVVENYNFYVTEEPHAIWKGHMCMTWVKQRVVTGYFFASYDTVDSMSIQTLSTIECQNMVETHDCDGNKMKEISPNLFSYKASPNGKGTWMQTKVEKIKNCIVQEITLKKDCRTCPITSAFGILTNDSNASSAITHDSTII
jgi:hypothetical protein